MIEVSKAIGLHEFVKELSDGYGTRLGTGGLKLSAGNRQRIGIARALISEPYILITDEATATLDPESAEEIIEAIGNIMKDKTNIVIVHRVLMAKDADQVVVMAEGRVAEEGDHEELMRKPDGLYREIFVQQYGAKRLPPLEPGSGS